MAGPVSPRSRVSRGPKLTKSSRDESSRQDLQVFPEFLWLRRETLKTLGSSSAGQTSTRKRGRKSVGNFRPKKSAGKVVTEKMFLSTFPKNSLTKSELLNVTQKVLSGVQVTYDELRGKSFFFTCAKNSLVKSGLLRKSRRKSKRRTKNWPVETRSWGWRSSRR